MTLNEGPYEKFGDTYAFLYGQWIAAGKYEPADGPSLEFYLSDPNTTEPEDLQTEVCVPIRD